MFFPLISVVGKIKSRSGNEGISSTMDFISSSIEPPALALLLLLTTGIGGGEKLVSDMRSRAVFKVAAS